MFCASSQSPRHYLWSRTGSDQVRERHSGLAGVHRGPHSVKLSMISLNNRELKQDRVAVSGTVSTVGGVSDADGGIYEHRTTLSANRVAASHKKRLRPNCATTLSMAKRGQPKVSRPASGPQVVFPAVRWRTVWVPTGRMCEATQPARQNPGAASGEFSGRGCREHLPGTRKGGTS